MKSIAHDECGRIARGVLVNDMQLMIISRRDEGMAVACQGLTADLVISSSMFERARGESNTSGAKSGMRGAGDQ